MCACRSILHGSSGRLVLDHVHGFVAFDLELKVQVHIAMSNRITFSFGNLHGKSGWQRTGYSAMRLLFRFTSAGVELPFTAMPSKTKMSRW